MTSSKNKTGGFVDPVSNFPTLTPKHNSLAANVLLNRPDLYTKYCNSVTTSGFTFDNAIQVGKTYVSAAITAAAAAAFGCASKTVAASDQRTDLPDRMSPVVTGQVQENVKLMSPA